MQPTTSIYTIGPGIDSEQVLNQYFGFRRREMHPKYAWIVA